MMKDYYKYDNLDFDKETATSSLSQLINNKLYGQIHLIIRDNMTIGYIALTLGFSLEFKGVDAFVDEIYIKEEFRGHGAGAKALEFIDGICLSLGVKALHLEVERKNIEAQGLYRKSGFVDHDRYLMTKWIKK